MFRALRKLLGWAKHESMTAMGTYYKPSQWHGKRLVYRTADPDEPRTETRKVIKFLVAGIIWFAIIWLVSRWGA